MFTYNLFSYCGNNPIIRADTGGAYWETVLFMIDPVLHMYNTIAVAIGIDTAAIGAFFLDMTEVDGIYHADFDCWQQYFGYNAIYDVAFDIATSMMEEHFSFTYNGAGYTIWIWKGDYINLGAGAEMGIYRGTWGHRTVDKSLAMKMAIIVRYKGQKIISYSPQEPQWWITSFDPNTLNVKASDLSVLYGIRFNDYGMYKAFQEAVSGDFRWVFHGSNLLATFRF